MIYETNTMRTTGGEVSDGDLTDFVGVKVAKGQRLSVRTMSPVSGIATQFEFIIYGVM